MPRYFALLILLVWSNVYAGPLAWRPVTVKNGIALYQQAMPSGQVRIKAEFEATASVSNFMKVMQDTTNAPNWLDRAKIVTVLSHPSELEYIVYTEFFAPWPFKNRYMVTYSRYQFTANGRLDLQITDRHPSLAEFEQLNDVEHLVRLKEMSALWQVTPLDGEKVNIEYQASADPNGLLPDWLTNKLVLKSALTTLSQLKKTLENSKQ